MPLDGTNYAQQDEVPDLLLRARERVVQGWCTHAGEIDGRFCLTAAVCRDDASIRLQNSAILFLKKSLPDTWSHGLVAYNDAPGRTQAEIVALFDRAIAMREGK